MCILVSPHKKVNEEKHSDYRLFSNVLAIQNQRNYSDKYDYLTFIKSIKIRANHVNNIIK